MAEKESGELIFLRYAFPAIECCGHKKVEIDEFLEFEKMLREGGIPSRKRLEEIYPNAVMHIGSEDKDWTPENVRNYWWVKHKEIVGDNFNCRVYGFPVSDVFEATGNIVCKVGMGGNIRFPSYIQLKREDYFTAHNFTVAEKITEDDYNKFFKK
jgi:hypothetical protein